jgi:hypothetical protein
MMPYTPFRVQFYQFIHAVWRHSCDGRPLTGDARLYAQVLARHLHWAHYWEMADDLGDIQVIAADGRAPFAIVALEAGLEREKGRVQAAW